MANIAINISHNSFDKFVKKLNKVAETLQKQYQKEIRVQIKEAADKTITANKELFILPHDKIGEFGVGENSAPDLDKVNNAWRGLLPDFGAKKKVTTIDFIKKNKKEFGFRFIINTNFYSLDTTTYVNRSENADIRAAAHVLNTSQLPDEEIIPWMEWFIEGETIGGVHFKELGLNQRNARRMSRTGLGLMIQGGFWDWQPRTEVWDTLEKELKISVTATIDKFLKRLDVRRLVR